MATPRKTTPTAKPARQKKTPQQRAQEQHDVAARKVARLERDEMRLTRDLQAVTDELADAKVRLDYYAGHPDLQATTPTQTTTSTQDA